MKSDELPCPKCKEPIKTEASICKHCGHEMSDAEVAKRVEDHQKSQAIGCGCVFVLGLILFLAFCTGEDDGPDSSASSTIESVEDRRKGFHCLSAWDGSHTGFKENVRRLLRDPDSFEHIETRVTPVENGSHTISMQYRARNGFGGMNVETALGTYDNATCVASQPIMSN